MCLFFLFSVLLFIFSSCQEESEYVTPPPTDKVILPNSAVAGYIQRIALNDGSSDNIVDHASCIALVLPVNVVVNGHEMQIDSADDFNTVERILDEFENDSDTLHIIYPFTVTLADYTEMIIGNAEDFEDVVEECIEGGHDEDIECVDFQYPLTFTVYDSQNQLSRVVTINDDQELFEFFDSLKETDLASFKFPVMVTLAGGEEITINSNDQLEDVIEDTMGDCDEDDDNDHNDDDADDTEFVAVILNGNWQITSFFEGTDQTDSFAGFVFTFHADGNTLATDGVSSIYGIWDTNGDYGFIEFELDLEAENPFDRISEDWQVVEFNSSRIKLQNVNETDQSVTTLVLEKE